jgi:hypothetical protein
MLMTLWYRFEYRMSMVDVYLARCRNDLLAAANSECRANECLHQIALLEIQK